MKTKELFRCAMMAFCAIMTAVLMSCNSEKGNNPDKPSTPTNPENGLSAVSQYSFATDDDMMDLFYIKVEYLDANGKTQNVTLNDAAWVEKVEAAKLPAKFGMRVNITMKGMADLTKYKEVAIYYTASCISWTKDAQGKKVGTDHRNIVDVEKKLAPNEVSEWVENYKKKPYEFWFEYDENGNYKISD